MIIWNLDKNKQTKPAAEMQIHKRAVHWLKSVKESRIKSLLNQADLEKDTQDSCAKGQEKRVLRGEKFQQHQKFLTI